MGAGPPKGSIYTPARKYQRFTKPHKITVYCRFPDGRDYSDKNQCQYNFVRTLTGHFVGISFCKDVGGFIDPMGIELDPAITDVLPEWEKYKITLITPEDSTTITFSDGENAAGIDYRTEMRALYFNELRNRGVAFGEDIESWYKEEFIRWQEWMDALERKAHARGEKGNWKTEKMVEDEFSELIPQPSGNFVIPATDYYEVKLMTEEYRTHALVEIRVIFGDNAKEIASFCGIPLDEEEGKIKDIRGELFKNVIMFPETMAKSKENLEWYERRKSEFKRLAFDNDKMKMLRFGWQNPIYIPWLVMLEQESVGNIFLALLTGAVIIFAILVEIFNHLY